MAKRGFGSPKFDRARLKQICSMGGKAAHRYGLAHEWTSETAAIAGKKGGMVASAKRAKVVA